MAKSRTAALKLLCFDAMARHDGLAGLRGLAREIDAFQFLARDRIAEHQDRQLQRLVAHAYRTVPYYQRIFREHGIAPDDIRGTADLPKLPYLTNQIIRQHHDDLVSRALTPEQIHDTKTGGTTGARMSFVRDNASRLPKQAALLCFETWAGWAIGQVLGVIWPARMDYLQAPGWRSRVKNALFWRLLMLPAYQLDPRILADMVRAIARGRPAALRGFTTPLCELAAFVESRKERLPQLNGITSTGEPLYPRQRALMERAFGCRVFNSYRSRELGPVGQECEVQEGMHVNEHGLIVESVISNRGNGVGELVCTDLYNYGMPFLRYRTGDSGTLHAAACRCGRSTLRIADVGGRLGDIFVTRDGRSVLPTALVLYLIDEAPGEVGQLQIIQEDYARFQISMTGEQPASNEVRDYHAAVLKKLFGEDAQVDHRWVEAIPREASGKVIYAKSRIGKASADAGRSSG